MAYRLYQKLISAMANEGVCNASDVDMSVNFNDQPHSKVSTIINAIISFINGLRETLSNLVSTGLKREIVQTLPTENISETTIYLILKDPAGASGDIYDEYMRINNAWEHIGSTAVDLSNYVQKPSNISDGKRYVMRNGAWAEADAAGVTYSGSVNGATNVNAAIEALALDATTARQLKAAIGSEVGNIATESIAAGTIVLHNGQFYKINNNIYEGDRWGEEIDATPTTLSDVIKSLESNKVSYPTGGNSNTQYVMRNGQWVEVQIATDAESITYSGDIPSAANVKAAIDALAADSVIAQQFKTAIGDEVGVVWPRAFAVGELAWHGGHLYRVTNATVVDDPWDAIDVAETTLSDEINALRGVSSESVYLTIQPTSAIPQAGVTARIYNIKTQTYMAEETILPSANRVHLGDVPFGDDYTIIMPSIDGYTQPADLTFKASQMIRERTAQYIESSTGYEQLTIKATKSNSAAMGSCSATIKLYNGSGVISETIVVSIEGGISEAVNIPLGTKYSVTFSDISGFITPNVLNLTARASHRNIIGQYVYLLGSNYKWVINNNGDISYKEFDQDVTTEIGDGSLYGVAILTSSLVSNNAAFIHVFSLSESNSAPWSNPAINVPSANNSYNGQSNSANVLDAIAEYESQNNVTVTSAFKIANSINTGLTVDGIPVKMYVPAYQQGAAKVSIATQVNNILNRYDPGNTITRMKTSHFLTSNQDSASQAGTSNGVAANKTASIQVEYVLPLITVSTNNS